MNWRNYRLWIMSLHTALFFAILTAAPVAFAVAIPNPIEAKSFEDLINNLAYWVRVIALPLAAVAIVFVGFKLIIAASSGDSKGLGEAKKFLAWVVIGTAIVVGASVLAQAVVNFAKELK